ncbi:hypothetical protein [Actinoplanes teichomyceticus]|uniref:Uncharacterized protein n=1 Tax=Actinoplanes teichomyceticus TaxID=1867 RepID=A0A561VCQ8_ACTTI|nr:hypothetical protein [Actinoplanes teichomyceticus]TWG09398.1 hypothetical protein FHX34_108113 [Actinoplanes teichomyceticus]GIF17019.1 hypothetical protein Ate01nite_70510 [Actinoplanes teichomyceticus]
MTGDGAEGYPSREDRIVAEFGDGLDVEGIAHRYGLTVAQVYAVIEREVGPAGHTHPGLSGHPAPPYPATGHHPPPTYPAPGHQPPGYHVAPPSGYQPPPVYPPPGPGYQPPPVYPPPAHQPPGYPAPGYQAPPPTPEHYAPPAPYAPPGYAGPVPGYAGPVPGYAGPVPAFPDVDAIVAEYGEGHDVESIARRHGLDVRQVYEVVQRAVTDDPAPPTAPPPSW